MQAYKLVNGQWQLVFQNGPFATGFDQPQYYETIQLADVNRDGTPELLGRDSGGVSVYQWQGSSWSQLVTDVPALADTPWASYPS
jgi:hypothetical protein